MIVVGSGAIGVEFASFYNSMGTEVTIVEYMPNVVPVEDEEVSKQFEKSLKKARYQNYDRFFGRKCGYLWRRRHSNCKKPQKGEEKLEADIVLSAVGIKTHISKNIGLEDVGIITDKDKITVNDWYQTNMPGYYAIGDVTHGPALAHVASAEGIICVEKIKGMHVQKNWITATSPAVPTPHPKSPLWA